jgi:hypothetical protein
MRRFVPLLHIAIVTANEEVACDLAERINEQGYAPHHFNDVVDLGHSAEFSSMDVILIDRRNRGFAMTLHALRAKALASHVLVCAFGPVISLVPAGLDRTFASMVSDLELCGLINQAISGKDVERYPSAPVNTWGC